MVRVEECCVAWHYTVGLSLPCIKGNQYISRKVYIIIIIISYICTFYTIILYLCTLPFWGDQVSEKFTVLVPIPKSYISYHKIKRKVYNVVYHQTSYKMAHKLKSCGN